MDLSRHYWDLTGADLTGADLSGACLSDARLIGAHLSKAKLAGVDPMGAIYMPASEPPDAYVAARDATRVIAAVGRSANIHSKRSADDGDTDQ